MQGREQRFHSVIMCILHAACDWTILTIQTDAQAGQWGILLGYATWQREFSLEVLGNSEQTIETISRTEKNKKNKIMKVGIMNTVCFGK